MNKKIGVSLLCFMLIFGTLLSLDLKLANAVTQIDGKTLVLYDSASGVIPTSQLMNFIDFPLGEAAIFNTTTGQIDYQLLIVNDTYTLTADE